MSSTDLNAAVRKALEQIFRTQVDFAAFVLDNFPDVHHRFAGGDRIAQTSLLLEIVGSEPVLVKLKCLHPGAIAKIEVEFGITISLERPPPPPMSTSPSGSPSPPAKLLTRGAEPPTRKSHLGLLMILIGMLIALGVALSQSLSTPTTVTILQMIHVGLALLATVTCYALGPTFGVFKNRWGRVSGSGAVFLIVLGLLFVSKSDLKDEWKVPGEIIGLPDDKPAQVQIGECFPTTIPKKATRFQLNVSHSCAQEPDDLVIQVENYEEQRERVASLRKSLRIQWISKWIPTRLEGHVYNIDGVTAANGVDVSLDDCPGAEGHHVVTDYQGKFLLDSVPPTCRSSYKLLCSYNGKKVCEVSPEKPYGIKIITDLRSGPWPPTPDMALSSPEREKQKMMPLPPRPAYLHIRTLPGQKITIEGPAGEHSAVATDPPEDSIERAQAHFKNLRPGTYWVFCTQAKRDHHDGKQKLLKPGDNERVDCP